LRSLALLPGWLFFGRAGTTVRMAMALAAGNP